MFDDGCQARQHTVACQTCLKHQASSDRGSVNARARRPQFLMIFLYCCLHGCIFSVRLSHFPSFGSTATDPNCCIRSRITHWCFTWSKCRYMKCRLILLSFNDCMKCPNHMIMIGDGVFIIVIQAIQWLYVYE